VINSSSATSISTTVPTGANTGKISVTTSAGTAVSVSDFTVTTSSTSGPPIVTSFSPASGPVGSVVTINGTNLSGATKVTFGSSTAEVTSNTDSEVKAIVPAVKGKLPSSVKITVTTAQGNFTTSNRFTITSNALSSNLELIQDDEFLTIYPNPFTDKAIINYSIQEDSDINISLYDEKGALVTMLLKGKAKGGKRYNLEVDGSKLSSGIYLVQLQSRTGILIAKLIFEK
jgi:hypothetical protein